MAWKDKLEKLEREVAEQRDESARQVQTQTAIAINEVQKVFIDLGIIENLRSIRDEIWGAGEIRHELTPYGFEAELFYDYPQYFPESWISSNSDMGTDTRIPPAIGFKRESLKINLHSVSTSASLRIYFSYADYDLLLKRRHEFSQKYGAESSNRFWNLYDSSVLICDIKLGQELSSCKGYLEQSLLNYCAVKNFMSREELLEMKSVNVIRALRGELPVEHINYDAVNVLREEGLLQDE